MLIPLLRFAGSAEAFSGSIAEVGKRALQLTLWAV
jgi:hypothetical protein